MDIKQSCVKDSDSSESQDKANTKTIITLDESKDEESAFKDKSNSRIKKPKKIKNDGAKIKKHRQEMSLFIDKKRTKPNLTCSYDNIAKQYISFNLSMPRKFMIAGGILVELANPQKKLDADDDQVCCFKCIQSILKHTNGNVIVNLQTLEAQYDFSRVIQLLQSTQNYDDYQVSLRLMEIQQPILYQKTQIELAIQTYSPNILQNIIYLRKKYIEQVQKKQTELQLQEDDFGMSVSYVIDWSLRSMGNAQSIMTKPLIALFGMTTDDFIFHMIRSNIIQIITPESRRRILQQSMEFLTKKDRTNFSHTFKDFEIRLLDNIFITCDALITINMIQYPIQLQLQHPVSDVLNNSECISMLKFDLTPSHLEKIISIRNQQMVDLQSKNLMSLIEKDEYILKNFEYYLQSSIFLEKYYNKKKEQQNTNESDENNRCTFKYVS